MISLTARELGQTFEVPVEGVLRPARFVAFAVNNGQSTYSFECIDGSDLFHIAASLDGIRSFTADKEKAR